MEVRLIIPTYNSARTLPSTLESLLGQGKDLQCISGVCLSDDRSTDETLSLAKRTWKARTSLEVLVGGHVGERGNVNRALAALPASTEWVIILHSDDLIKPNGLRSLLSHMERCGPQVASVCSSWDVLHSDGSVTAGEDFPLRSPENIEGNRESVRSTLLRGCWWHLSGCAIRLTAWRQIGPFGPRLPQLGDWEWLLRCLSKGWDVVYIPRSLIVYRQHPASVSFRSFQSHRDILEALWIVRAYQRYLAIKDLVAIHSKFLRFMIRRMGRAVLQLRLDRIIHEIWICARITWNLLRCLTKQPGHD